MFYGVHFYYLEEHLLLSMKRSIYVDRYQWEWQSLLQGRRFKTFQAKEDGQKICKEGNHQQGKGTQTMQLTDTCWPDSAPGLLEHLFWNDPILWQCWRSRISTMTSNHQTPVHAQQKQGSPDMGSVPHQELLTVYFVLGSLLGLKMIMHLSENALWGAIGLWKN